MGTPLTDLWWPLLVAPFAISPLLVLAVIGLLFAPFAAAINAVTARRRGRSAGAGALGGLVASLVLFLPWTCLLAKNLRWQHANGLIKLSYALMLVIWGVSSIGILAVVGILFVLAFVVSLISGGIFAGAVGASIFIAPLGLVVILLNVTFWWRLRRVLAKSDYSDWPQGEPYVPLVYLEPFLAAYFWSVMTPLILFGVAWATLTFTFGAV